MTDDGMLAHLLSGGSKTESAWKEFLSQYSKLFLKIIWQFEKDHDEVMERYVYVCSKLAADNFAVLRRYREQSGDDPPRLEHWLAVVVRNMCVDVHRSVHGRHRLPRAMQHLSEFDRQVFKLFYWMGASIDEISHRIGDGRNGTAESVNKALSRIEQTLTRMPDQHESKPVFVSYDENLIGHVEESEDELALELEQMSVRWIARLSDQERLVVRLRFWEDMTAKQIATLLKIIPEYRVYTILQSALSLLRKEAAKEL